MIYESERDIANLNKFIIDYGDHKFNALKEATSYVKLDTDNKTIVIDLIYTRGVLLLNKYLQKDLKFNLSYSLFNTTSESVFNNVITINDILFNLSTKDDHQPIITLYCTFE